MTTAAKLSMLKSILGISDSTQDTLLGVYLTFAKLETISWRYGYSTQPNIAKAVDSKEVPITVSATVFIEKLTPVSGTSYVFTYSETAESWQYASADVELEEYGIGYDNYYTPIDAETITVAYNEHYIAEYDTIQVMACVVGYSLRGAEGQTSHNENGIQRSFQYADMVKYIHEHVNPIVGVI